jgi:hypothetical protein
VQAIALESWPPNMYIRFKSCLSKGRYSPLFHANTLDMAKPVNLLRAALPRQGCYADDNGQTNGRSDDGRRGVRDLDAL